MIGRERYLVVHGHFYQPPRENAWTESIDPQPSAAPFRDWNARIHRECYLANAYARVVDATGRIVRLQNNFELLSFNVGPTLMSWLAEHARSTYERILEGDRRSVRARGGHGNAIAQAYNHPILPLCSARDRRTQIAWGLRDFEHRFGRPAEAMWLPETAIDDATASDLVDAGMRFAILAPHQIARVREPGGPWKDVAGGRVDPTQPYLWRHPDGKRSLALFAYDGPLSQAIAFQGALGWGTLLLDRIGMATPPFDRPVLVHCAADGETFGHHVRFGERTIAWALGPPARERGYRLTNYAELLDRFPPRVEAELAMGPGGEGTAWSCSHGLGRWCRDCGCNVGSDPSWNQAWRGPLRRALDGLRDDLACVHEDVGSTLLRDPWGARERYIEVVLSPTSRDAFLAAETIRAPSRSEASRALALLEMQRHAFLMFTSCGWFFDDIAGIEAVQVLQYAARALDACEEAGGAPPVERFLDELSRARSNQPGKGSGADVYRKLADPARYRGVRVVGDIAMRRAVLGRDVPDVGMAHGARYTMSGHHTGRAGRLAMVTGRVRLERARTLREETFAFAALHLGGADTYAVVRRANGESFDAQLLEALWIDFGKRSLPLLLLNVSRTLGGEELGFADVIGEGRAQILELVHRDLVERFALSFARLYEDHHTTLEELASAGLALPPELSLVAAHILGRRLLAEIEQHRKSQDVRGYARAIAMAREAVSHGYPLDRAKVGPVFAELLDSALGAAIDELTAGAVPSDALTTTLHELLDVGRQIGLDPTDAQNLAWDRLVEPRVPLPESAIGPWARVLADLGFAREIADAVHPARVSLLPP
ncbi:MAG: DUF3536 domain-containing protein [Deltaproteobacteria bacterium]|nr:DUF3536 domain-containing protein [Deltaproteobacteria bacterium]